MFYNSLLILPFEIHIIFVVTDIFEYYLLSPIDIMKVLFNILKILKVMGRLT